jgi:hypothetical protein
LAGAALVVEPVPEAVLAAIAFALIVAIRSSTRQVNAASI